MLAHILAAIVCAQPVAPPAIEFSQLAIVDVARLNGAEVVITFTPGRPAYTWAIGFVARAVTGPAELDDDQERTVILRGNQLGRLRGGKPVKAVGVVRVIHHDAAKVGPVIVPAWDEICFEER